MLFVFLNKDTMDFENERLDVLGESFGISSGWKGGGKFFIEITYLV